MDKEKFNLTKNQAQESEAKKPEYKFQHLGDFLALSTAMRVKFGEEGYEEAEEIEIKPKYSGRTEPQDESGITENQEMDVVDAKIKEMEKEAKKHWWLTREYQNLLEKGELAEQIAVTVEAGDIKNNINIYVFGEPLPKIFISEIQKALFFLSQIDNGAVFNLVEDIIIYNDNKIRESRVYNEEISEYKDIKISAQTVYATQIIEIFYRGLKVEAGRGLELFSSFVTTFLHEFAHFIERKRLEKGWQERLGWRGKQRREPSRTLKTPPWKSKTWTKWILSKDSKPPTDYARNNPYEDFADSFAFLMLEPEKLDPNRRDFIIDEVLKQKSVDIHGRPKVDTAVLQGGDMVLPHLAVEKKKYKITRGRMSVSEFFSRISKRTKAKIIEEKLLESFDPTSAKDIKTNAEKTFRYEWWTRNPQYKEIMEFIEANNWTYTYRHAIEGVIRYFGPTFIEKELSGLSVELSKLSDKRENLHPANKIIAEKMLELATIVASRVDLREHLHLVSLIEFFQYKLKRAEEWLSEK